MNIRNRVKEMKMMSPKDVVFNEKNWRKHPAGQSKALQGVLEEIGIAGAMLAYYSERNGGKLTLVDGHLRKELAPGEEWPVLITDLNDAEADLLLASYDPISAMATADKEKLNDILQTVRTDNAAVQDLIANVAKNNGLYLTQDNRDAEPQIDRAEELNRKWQVETGDLWKIGEHRLLCSDSKISENVRLAVGDTKACLVFTDPPYGVSVAEKNRLLNSVQPSGRCLVDIEDDNLSPDELKEKLMPVFNNIREIVMADDCSVFVTAPQIGDLFAMMMMLMDECKLPVRHVLMWKKNCPTFSMGRLDYDYQHEPILLTWLKKHKRPMLGQHRTSVWEIDKPRANAEHPTMKPIELYENAFLNNSDPGDVVFDAYCGSGPLFVAAQNTGRTARGLEKDPNYCAVILERMQTAFPELEIKKLS